MYQNQAKKTPPPPIGMPRNGNMESVGTLFGDLLISRPRPPPEKINGNERGDADRFQRYDFNNTPIKLPLKNNVNSNEGARKTPISHVMGDDYDRKQSSTNSNSPMSNSPSLDDMYDEQKACKKPSFFSSLHHDRSFSDDEPGASSMFSSGM